MLNLDGRRFNRLAASAITAMFVLLVVAFAAGIMSLVLAQRSNERVDHTYQVVGQLAEVDVWVERAETASRGYLLVPDPLRANTFRENVDKIAPALDRLARFTDDNPVQERSMIALRRQIDDELATLESIMAKATSGQLDQARQQFAAEVPKRRVNAIRATTGSMRAEEQRLLTERGETERSASRLSQIVLGVTGLLLLITGVGAVWLVRRYTGDLTAARDRLDLLNADLEGAVVARTADLQRANDEIQRFAYIVSHDLRSPLVNVMGFTAELDSANWQIAGFVERVEKAQPDLITEADRTAALEDLPEAVGFIRKSTQTMDRLINAILALSRQGKRVLTPETLPMDKVIADVAASLEMLAAERNARFIVQDGMPTLYHDRLAVEQIFTSLMENATKYLVPDRPGVIEVRGRTVGKRAIFEVEDNGRGIAEADLERVFDLFRRAGTQDQKGEGIGLANVRALAYRLGGIVRLRSQLGEGSTFTVELPTGF